MSSEDRPSNLEPQAPVGTLVLLCLVAIGMTAAWLFLYFGVFLPRGAVS